MDSYAGQNKIIDFIKAAWISRLIEVKQIQVYPLIKRRSGEIESQRAAERQPSQSQLEY